MEKVVFLGGASSGGTAIAVALPDGWLLVDYGMDLSSDPVLPSLDALDDRPIVACILTHAHLSHCGGLPLLARKAPRAGLYASPPTIRLLPVLLNDAYRRMEAMQRRDGRPLPWSQSDGEAVIRRLRPLEPGIDRVLPTRPGVHIRTTPSGHIVGSVSVGIRTASGSLVVSSHIGSSQQRTVAGPSLPPLIGVDLLVLEATYGDRFHPPRDQEESRLVADVAAVVARGGLALIPAFALGRTQEVLCILAEAMQRRDMPNVPVYLDGLAGQVTDVYTAVRDALHPALAIQIDPFEPTDPFRGAIRVSSAAQRATIMRHPPAVIIAGSGMLHGGAALAYADAILDNARDGIFLVGSVTPTAIGAAVLRAAAIGEPVMWQGSPRSVACHVAQYLLSAHADADALFAYAQSVAPRRIALVNGDNKARHALRRRLVASGVPTSVPTDGTHLPVGSETGNASR